MGPAEHYRDDEVRHGTGPVPSSFQTRYPVDASMSDFDAIAESITFDQFCDAVGAEKRGRGRTCPLPARHRRGDKKPSFSGWHDNGRLMLKCHGGTCGLLGTPVQVAAEVWGVDLPEAGRRLARHIGLPTFSAGREIVATYDYVDESGELLSQVVRFSPKSFLQRRPDGENGWVWNLGGVRRVLYRLPAVLEAAAIGRTVYVVEGERDVHAIENAGGVATTGPGGAGKWRADYSEALRGAHVIVVADRDDAGLTHGWSVYAALEGVAASVRVVQAREGKDAADHLEAGRRLDEFDPADPGGGSVAVPRTLLRDPRLGANDIALYAILADFGAGTVTTYAALGARLGRPNSGSAAKRAARNLRDTGWASSKQCGNGNKYTLHRAPITREVTDDPSRDPREVAGDLSGTAGGETRQVIDDQAPDPGDTRGVTDDLSAIREWSSVPPNVVTEGTEVGGSARARTRTREGAIPRQVTGDLSLEIGHDGPVDDSDAPVPQDTHTDSPRRSRKTPAVCPGCGGGMPADSETDVCGSCAYARDLRAKALEFENAAPVEDVFR